jgi:hypothetical protein
LTGFLTSDADSVEPLTDDELTALALAADIDTVVEDDAVPLWDLDRPHANGLLPDWYMPAPMGARPLSGWRRRFVRCNVFLIIMSFVVINAAGLCSTYGELTRW